MTMTKPHTRHMRARRLAKWTLAVPALIGCTQSADIGQGGPRASDEQVEQTKQALNTGFPSEQGVYPSKGHTQVLLAAFKALSKRNLVPPQMTSPENQYYIHYGNYFSDNTWVGRPGTLAAQRVFAHQTLGSPSFPTAGSLNMLNAINGEVLVSSGYDRFRWNDWHTGWDTLGVPISVLMTLTANGKVHWVNPASEDKPNTYLEFKMTLNLDSYNWATGSSPMPVDKTYNLDNLYHYALRDVYEMPGLTQAERDANATLRLYPLVLSDLGDPTDHDIANRAINYIVNQPILANADRGITKYGAILYQLARKFFSSSCHEPSLSELIPAGNDRPGWNVGVTRGAGVLSEFSLDYPHTVLGGMPYMCANGSDPKDICADGLPTWPIWVPDGEPPNAYYDPTTTVPWEQRWLAALNGARPGHSDRAALIYLGWATHMIQDAATPHHAANWVGFEHDRQDGYGDDPNYWRQRTYGTCPDGGLMEKRCWATKGTPPFQCNRCSIGGDQPKAPQYTLSLEEYTIRKKLDDLLGTESSPKTRGEICNSVNITDSQMLNGELNYKSVQPVFLSTAADAFAMKKESTTDAPDINTYIQGYLGNAVLSTIKILLCAPPAPGESCPATPTVDEPLNQGTIAGTQQRYPWDFNVFTFGDAMGLHDVAGPVAAEGAIHMSSFSLNGSSSKPVALVAGGDLQLANGTVYGVIHAGGGGTIDATVTRSPPTIKIDNPISFYTMYVRLDELSQALRDYPSTGTTTPTASGVRFAGSLPGYNVFSVSGAALVNYRTFELAIPAGATAVINVLNDLPNETPVTFQNAGFILNGTDYRRILWNFNGVQKISMASITFPGTALAPDAAVDTKYGGFGGTLFAKSLVSTYTEFYWDPFGGDFPPVELTPPGPCTPAAVPTATATPGDGRVVLSWTASAGATSYLVESRTASQTEYTPIAHVTTGTTYTHMNLSNGTTYYYVVTADKGSCSSGPSVPVSATPASACTLVAPTGVTANPGSQQVTLTWTAATGATSYQVGRSTTSGTGYASVGTVNAPTTTFLDNDTTLVSGTTYYYVVTAHNGTCGSPNSTEVSATPTSACTQAAPTGVTANPASQQVTLTWTAATGATSYQIGRSTTSGTGYASVGTVNAPTTTYLDNAATLANGTTYYYVVTAYNGTCGSPNSTEVSATPGCTPPAVPTGVTATANNSNGSITVAWGTVTGATGYTVSRSTSLGGTYTPVSTNQANTTYTDSTGLTTGTSYYYKVSANNAGGTCASAGSSVVSAVSCTLPAVPTGVTATANNSNGSITVAWGTVTGATGYTVSRSTSLGGTYTPVSTNQANTTYTDSTGLTSGASYYYKVSASNAGGICASASSSAASAVSCTLPAVPTGLNATVGAATPGSGKVALTWTASTNASSYEVLRSTTSGSGYNSIATPTTNSFTDSGLTNNTTYYYVVRARNGVSGCSTGDSTQVSATPQGCQVLPASQNAFTLNTTNAVCFVTCWDLAAGSWNCNNFTQANRTLTINGQAVNCGGTVPAKVNSGYTISVGPGGHTWDQINWWDNSVTHAHACP